MKNFHKRIISTMNRILSKYDDVLIVGHGGFFGNMTDIMDLGYIKIPNGIPYKLIPTRNDHDSWTVQNLCNVVDNEM